MSHMTDEEFVAAEGCLCPVCRSADIVMSPDEDWKCIDCNSIWHEVHKLSGYILESTEADT